eukprot:CAMPEP_0205945904 /NCGR_PEP_ID=MMETSP1325-20131115/67571_1 /ASSEMBLY_ACC=CAM_ASM_000708 /TAXON_ID=236786 /ORGANISM="Florenciella sp., Strain RCC1007" /LENGTH=39 /DNA_ID= /DNA_START= /DNA_END= /DNA_ORIENTATION=
MTGLTDEDEGFDGYEGFEECENDGAVDEEKDEGGGDPDE